MSNFTMIRSFIGLKIDDLSSRKRILRLQEKKFRRMLKFAYNNSKFYHDFYYSKGITEKDLNKINIDEIPTVDKDLIMDNFDDVVTIDDLSKKELFDFLEKSKNPNDLFKGKYHVLHTSGSIGKLGIFVYSKRDWDFFAPFITRSFSFTFRKKKAIFLGATGGHFTGFSFISYIDKGLSKFFCEPLILDINTAIEDIIKRINVFQPDILGGYFNGLKVLAEQQERGDLHIHPTLIVNCGEGVITKDKEYIEKIFNAPLSNLYGCAECVLLGVGKNEYNGIYLMDDLALIEIKENYILLTNLYNKTQPIIRYRIDDYIKKKEDPNIKTRFTLVENIIGRSEYIIWFENSRGQMDFIHPLIFVEFYVKGLDKHQLVIKDKTSFVFKAVIKDNDKGRVIQDIKKKLDKILAGKNFGNVKYSIEVVNDLTVNEKIGKFKLILNEKL